MQPTLFDQTPKTTPGPATPSWHAWVSAYGLLAALGVLISVLSLAIPNFFTVSNLLTVARQICTNGFLALGVTYVLLTGGVDLSVGSIVALTGVVAASFAHPGDYPLVVPILMGILAGLACGVTNGLIVTKGRVAPFIVTLGMMTVARGLALVLSNGRPVSNLSAAFCSIAGGNVLGVPIPVLILAFTSLISYLLLKRTRLGRYIYAVGGNESAAYASGIDIHSVKLFAYGISGALAGLAGVILASRITVGQPNAGIAFELDAIAAAVIGGTSLAGGVGGVGGTLLGVLLMGLISTGLVQLDVPLYYQQIVKGAIIIGAVWLDKRVEK